MGALSGSREMVAWVVFLYATHEQHSEATVACVTGTEAEATQRMIALTEVFPERFVMCDDRLLHGVGELAATALRRDERRRVTVLQWGDESVEIFESREDAERARDHWVAGGVVDPTLISGHSNVWWIAGMT